MSIWHDDPDLSGRFHPQYPDDLQVLVHEGSFRFTDTKPEVMWAHVVARLERTHETGEKGYAYRAVLLNKPHQLKTIKQNDEILFVAKQSYKLPVRVTHEYIMQRALYEISPCNKCGLPELFDLIPELWKKSFPAAFNVEKDDLRIVFSSFCPVCGGMMFVKDKRLAKNDDNL